MRKLIAQVQSKSFRRFWMNRQARKGRLDANFALAAALQHADPAQVYEFPTSPRVDGPKDRPVRAGGVVIRLDSALNSYEVAKAAILLMKQPDENFIDLVRDDRTISALMRHSHFATERIIEVHIQYDLGYPSEATVATALEICETTGIFGPG